MKQLLILCTVFLLVVSFTGVLEAQVTVDTGFTVAAQIKPSAYPGWPDSIGAEKVIERVSTSTRTARKNFWFWPILTLCRPFQSRTTIPVLFEASGNNTYNLIWSTVVPGNNDTGYQNADLHCRGP